MDLLRRLNHLNPEDGSTILASLAAPRYPITYRPLLVTPCPTGYTVFDWHVPLSILECLRQDEPELLEDRINWSLIGQGDRTVILSHFPAWIKGEKRPQKYEASVVRDTLIADRHTMSKFQSVAFINKYNILAQMAHGVNRSILAASLKSLDGIRIVDPSTNSAVPTSGKVSVVFPPQVLVCYLPSFDPQAVLHCVAAFGPIRSHQALPTAGQCLVNYEHEPSAMYAYGACLPGDITLTSGDPARDSMFSLSHRIQQLQLGYPAWYRPPSSGHPLTANALAHHEGQVVNQPTGISPSMGLAEGEEDMNRKGQKRGNGGVDRDDISNDGFDAAGVPSGDE